MIQDCTLLIDRWFKKVNYGINVFLPDWPRQNPDGGDYDEPEPCTIANDCEDEGVAKLWSPSTVSNHRSIIIWSESSAQMDHNNYTLAKRILLGIGFVTDPDVKFDQMTRECGYYFGATLMSLWKFNKQQLAGTARNLNGTKIFRIAGVTEQLVDGAAVGSSLMWGYLLVELWAGSDLFKD